MTATCCRCGRPDPTGGYACTVCGVERPREHLEAIAELLPVALDVAYGQTSGGPTIGGGTYGPRVQLNLTAKARLDAVRNQTTTWARHVSEERGQAVVLGGPDDGDAIARAVRFLDVHCEWMRHRAEVDEFVRDVAECAAVMRGLAAGPRERIYLGECKADVCVDCGEWQWPHVCDGYQAMRTCDGEVFGKVGAAKATCKDCGARYDQDKRIEERQAKAGQYTYTASEIASAYPALRANTITKWHGRGLLVNHGDETRPLYDVAEVLRVADSADQRHRQAIERRVAQGAGMRVAT